MCLVFILNVTIQLYSAFSSDDDFRHFILIDFFLHELSIIQNDIYIFESRTQLFLYPYIFTPMLYHVSDEYRC